MRQSQRRKRPRKKMAVRQANLQKINRRRPKQQQQLKISLRKKLPKNQPQRRRHKSLKQKPSLSSKTHTLTISCSRGSTTRSKRTRPTPVADLHEAQRRDFHLKAIKFEQVKKTKYYWQKFDEFCESLKRPKEHFSEFIGSELGIIVKLAEDKLGTLR